MAELAVTDGMPPPSDLPRGEFVASWHGSGLHIDRADPRILISGEALDVYVAEPLPTSWADTTACRPGHGYVGALLKIAAVNRTVIYRIVDHVPRINGYIGEWPD